MTKFSYEASYNKIYSNILNSGIGGIQNGLERDSYASYTSLSPAVNQLEIKDHLVTGNEAFILPENLLDFYEINNSYVFLI